MAIERWRPAQELARLEQQMDRWMDEFFGRWPFRRRRGWPFRSLWEEPLPETVAFAPEVDMFDKKDEIVVKAELPGVSKKDISVSVSGDVLTIKGERRKEQETRDEDYYCCERAYGAFARSLRLPVEVEVDKIKASYEDGILEIRLPKAEAARQKQIRVEVE